MTTTPVHEELIQAAADALLRFPDLPEKVVEQFEGYINGNLSSRDSPVWDSLPDPRQATSIYKWMWLVDIYINDEDALLCVNKYYIYLNKYDNNTCP